MLKRMFRRVCRTLRWFRDSEGTPTSARLARFRAYKIVQKGPAIITRVPRLSVHRRWGVACVSGANGKELYIAYRADTGAPALVVDQIVTLKLVKYGHAQWLQFLLGITVHDHPGTYLTIA